MCSQISFFWSGVPLGAQLTHLAQENHGVSELSLADGTDGASLRALLPCGSDPVILFEGEWETNIAVSPSVRWCLRDEEGLPWAAPSGSLGLGLTHLRGAKELQCFPESAHATADVERLKGEKSEG